MLFAESMSDKLTAEAEQNLKQLASCILDFVMELDGYRQTCICHDKSTAVTLAKNGTLWIRKKYKWSDSMQEIVQRTLSVLDGWEESPWWNSSRQWNELQKRVEQKEKPLFCKGVDWEGWPMLVSVEIDQDVATVATASPLVGSETLPELPLRKATMALKCHEFLVPEWVTAVTLVSKSSRGEYPIRSYLRRTWKDKSDPIYEMLNDWPS